MGKHCSILQIVGYQNSGKTTLMEKLITCCQHSGLKAASIKHHGHGGAPINELLSKDSIRHQRAGSLVSGVEGEGAFQLSASLDNWSLEKMIALYEFFPIDIILIEGYKQEKYPKVVLIRNQLDLLLLDSLSNIKCVISHVNIDKTAYPHLKIFKSDEDSLYIEFLMKEVVKKHE